MKVNKVRTAAGVAVIQRDCVQVTNRMIIRLINHSSQTDGKKMITTMAKRNRVLPITLMLILTTCGRLNSEGLPKKLSSVGYNKVIFAQVKKSLELACPIDTTEPDIFVDWFKGDESLYMEEGYEMTDKGTLSIKSVTKDHAGTYICEGVNGFGIVRINITVIVDTPESESISNTTSSSKTSIKGNFSQPVIKKRISPSTEAELGGQMTYHCVASGWPVPHLYWLKDGAVLDSISERGHMSAHSILHLRKLTKAQEGTYRCIARNKVGEDQIDHRLKVIDTSYPPRVISLEPEDLKIKEGTTVVFWCVVNSKPGLKLHIKWFKKLTEGEMDTMVDLGDRTLFRSGETFYRPINRSQGIALDGGVFKSKLIIDRTGAADSGTYVCLALNDKGFNFKNVTLSVTTSTYFAANSATNQSYFAINDVTFVIAGTVTGIILLIAVVLITRRCFRGPKVQKKTTYCDNMLQTAESESLKQSLKTSSSTDRVTESHTRSTLFMSDLTNDYPTV